MPSLHEYNAEASASALPHRPSLRAGSVTAFVLVFSTVLAALIALRVPLSVPEPGYLADVQSWSPATHIADTFTPLAYPLFLAPVYRIAGTNGIVALQAALYVATVYTAFLLLLQLELTPGMAGLGSLLILLHPEFFLSIPKIWDVGFSAFLFLLLVLVSLRLQREGPGWWRCILTGLVLGVGLFSRPNFALLVPVIAYAFWRAARRTSFARIATAGVVAAATFALAGVAAHGKPFWPRNGPYNLYAGDNPYSAHALLTKLNGEPSIDAGFRAAHPDLVPADANEDFYYSAALEPIYMRDAVGFVAHHPGKQVQLIAIKLQTLFRPDTKVHPLHSAAGAVQAVLALPVLLFLMALLARGRPPLTASDRLLLAFVVGYIAPFLLTNSDPRFRTPLDALLLLFTVSLAFRHAAARCRGGIAAV